MDYDRLHGYLIAALVGALAGATYYFLKRIIVWLWQHRPVSRKRFEMVQLEHELYGKDLNAQCKDHLFWKQKAYEMADKLDCADFEILAQLLTDPENQPHQFMGDKNGLLSVLRESRDPDTGKFCKRGG